MVGNGQFIYLDIFFSSADFCIVCAIDPTPVGTRPKKPLTYENVMCRLVSFKI